MKPKLHVNIDHVATLKRLRETRYPDVVEAARRCQRAGAAGITMHLREDRRHVRDDEVRQVRAEGLGVFNLEMAVTPDMVRFAESLRPDVATFVPERREERTTEGGLDVLGAFDSIRDATSVLHAIGTRVSLFVAHDPKQLEAARRVGADMVELHTGDYCGAAPGPRKEAELALLSEGAAFARSLGLRVAAGHGLYYDDVGPVAAMEAVEELNIGHGIVCRAVEVGLEEAVRQMLAAIAQG